MVEQVVWEQLQYEPADAYTKFVCYLGIGPSRTLTEAYRQSARTKKQSASVHISPQFSKMAQDWSWVERARAYDRHLNELQLRETGEKALSSGYALSFNRVIELTKMVDRLNEAIEDGKLFVQKRIGGATFEELDAALVREWRGLLDDLAKETNGRVSRKEVSGINGGPLQIDVQVYSPTVEPEDNFEELEDGKWS